MVMKWRSTESKTVASNQKKRNKVVMKLNWTPSSTKRESFRSSFVYKTCIIEGDLWSREVARALSKVSTGGLNEVLASIPQEVVSKLVGFAPKIKTIQQVQTSSSSSSCIAWRVRLLSSPVGNASGFLYGIQAKSVSFNSSCAGASDPQSAKPGPFSSGEPACFFTCVMAGTKGYRTRRWQTGGGREKVVQVDNFESQVLSSGSSGETEVFGAMSEFCLGHGETEVGGAVSRVWPW